jgi:hypothetical protein
VKPIALVAGLLPAFWATSAAASPEKDAVKAVIKSIKHGDDLSALYPGAISPREEASFRRVAKCDAINLMKQPGGDFTVVWDCGSKGALGMRVVIQDGRVSSISTLDIGMRPN